MFKQKKLIFALILFFCIVLSMSFAGANNINDNSCDELLDGGSDSNSEDLNNSDESNRYDIIYIIEPQEEPHVIINGDNNSGDIKVIDNEIKNFPSKFIAKNKVFSKKTKIKKYSVILKNNKGKAIKNTWITLKVKGKLFHAKTDNKGKATFKIKKLNKKGKYKATLVFKGSKTYKNTSKKIRITVK